MLPTKNTFHQYLSIPNTSQLEQFDYFGKGFLFFYFCCSNLLYYLNSVGSFRRLRQRQQFWSPPPLHLTLQRDEAQQERNSNQTGHANLAVDEPTEHDQLDRTLPDVVHEAGGRVEFGHVVGH